MTCSRCVVMPSPWFYLGYHARRPPPLRPQLRQLALDPLPLAHQPFHLGGELLLLVFELLHLVARGAVEVGGIAEQLVDLVDSGLGLLDVDRHLVALLGEILLAALALAV